MGKLIGLGILVLGILLVTNDREVIQLLGVAAMILGLLLAWKAEGPKK